MGVVICYLFVYMAEAFIAWQYADNIFAAGKNRKTEISVFLSGYFCMFIFSQMKLFWFNIIAFFIVNALIFWFLYYITLKHVLFHTLILTVVMAATEYFVIAVFGELLSAVFIYEQRLYILTLIAALSKLLYYVFTQILTRVFGKNKTKYSESGVIIGVLCLVPASVLWVLITFFFICSQQDMSKGLEWMVMISTILLLIVNMFIFWIYTYQRKKYSDFMNMQLHLQKEKADVIYYKELLKQREEQKLMIHDIKNHLNVVSGLVDEKKYGEAKEFLVNLVHFQVLETKINICDNSVLNAILANYVNICRNKKIALNLDIRNGCVDELNPEELSSLFGNILDNALEGCGEGGDSYIDLSVEYKSIQKAVVICMVNSCYEPPKKAETGGFVTRKINGRHHGLGLKSVERVAAEYGGSVKVYYDEEEKVFRTVILLYNAGK